MNRFTRGSALCRLFFLGLGLSCVATASYSSSSLEDAQSLLVRHFAKEFQPSILGDLEVSIILKQVFEDGPDRFQIEISFDHRDAQERVFIHLSNIFRNVFFRSGNEGEQKYSKALFDYELNMMMRHLYAVKAYRKVLFKTCPPSLAGKPFWGDVPPIAEIESIKHVLPKKGQAMSRLVRAGQTMSLWLSQKTKKKVLFESLTIKSIYEGQSRSDRTLVIPVFTFFNEKNEPLVSLAFDAELAWDGRDTGLIAESHLQKFYLDILKKIDLYQKYNFYMREVLGFDQFGPSVFLPSCVNYYRWLGFSDDEASRAPFN